MPRLAEMQLPARMRVFEWFKAGHVNPHLARNFEDTLYKDYKPFVEASPAPLSRAEAQYSNHIRYYLRYIFSEEHWEALERRSNMDFRLALMKQDFSPKEAAMLCACAFCEVDLEAETLS